MRGFCTLTDKTVGKITAKLKLFDGPFRVTCIVRSLNLTKGRRMGRRIQGSIVRS
jgi:hypothetical protein